MQHDRADLHVVQAASFLARQPDLSFEIPKQARAESWLLTTFLDEVRPPLCGDCIARELHLPEQG